MTSVAAVVELSDEVVALSELVTQWKAESAQAIAEQMELAALNQRMTMRQARMSALSDAADKIVQSMARNGRATYTVKELIDG